MHAFEAHIPRLRRYARALVRDPHYADDLVQDTLERACAKWHLWKSGSNLRAWLFTMMHHIFLNQLKGNASLSRLIGLDEAGEIAGPASSEPGMALRDLECALMRLSIEQRQVLLLIGLEDLKYAEVAKILEIPIGTVMSRLARARERLQQLLEGVDETAVALKVIK